MERLSTAAFYKELSGIDFTKKGPRLRIFNVDLDPEELETLIKNNDSLTIIESSDGAVSHVKDTIHSSPLDNSQSSRYFLLHTDGQYLPKVPEMVILHCIDPGSTEIPTVFVDTHIILSALKETSQLREAQEYQFVFKNKKGIEYRRPLIENHPVTQEAYMNIALASPQCHLEALPSSNKKQEDADAFYALLDRIAKEDAHYIVHKWEKGDLVVFDNLRLVHGRGLPQHNDSNHSDNQRHLCRIWIDRKEL